MSDCIAALSCVFWSVGPVHYIRGARELFAEVLVGLGLVIEKEEDVFNVEFVYDSI
jgi:hypothetical protein